MLIFKAGKKYMSAIIHRFNDTTKTPDRASAEKLKPFISKIETCLNTTLIELINRMFDCADDMLFQLADNSKTNEDQNKYFDAMRMLRVERKMIAQDFISHLNVYLDTSNTTPQTNNELCEDELSLIDQDEMEEMVAISTMQSKAVSLYSESISHLDARIEFLLLKSPGAFNKDALSPKNICESFKDALVNIELSTNNKLIIYKLFDQEVILKLDVLYTNLNKIFIDHGILPQIKVGYTRNTPRTEPKEQTITTDTLETDALYKENITYNTNQTSTFSNQLHNAQGNHSAQPQQFNAVDVINQLLSGKRHATGPNIPASFSVVSNSVATSGTKYYNRRDVMNALSNLQKTAAQSQYFYEPVNVAEFKRELFENIANQQGGAITRQVSQIDEKTIDFVEMLFEAITKDNSISEHITTLLLKLQIPVIKVALLDNQFFSNSKHPCRSTLNLIAYLGKGISSKKDNLFIELNSVVETILNDFNIDISSFKKSQAILEKIELDELHKTAEKEKITQIIELQSHAREVILNELQYHLKNKILPEVAKKLILKYWSTLMFHCYIKQGKNSNEWRDAISTINKLILFLQPIESSYAYNQLDTEKNTLLNTMHDQLLQTKQNPVEIEVEINYVLIHFENALSNSKFSPLNQEHENTYYANIDTAIDSNTDDISLDDDMPEPTLEIEEDTIDPLQEQSEIASKKISLLPENVRPGVWFKVHNPDSSTSRRAKLSVIIIEEAKLIFVDRLGAKVIEKDAEIFGQELEKGQSEAIADHSAFDHALASVINSLSVAI